MKPFVILLALVLLVTGCRTSGPKFDPLAASPAPASEGDFVSAGLTNRLSPAMLAPSAEPYRLGPGDIIEIETLGETKSSVMVPVGPDGKIYYNLLPGTSVWGLSIADTRALLQREMAKYTRAMPEFVINLRAVASKRMWVLGAVPSPGVHTLATPTTVLDALALSGSSHGPGGSTEARGQGRVDDGAADYSRTFILRNGKRLPVDFERLLKRGDLSQNIYLEPDDLIFVRPVEVPNIYLLGAVNSPQIFAYRSDMTVAQVLITAGGTVRYAQNGRVVIIRGGLTDPKIAEVDFYAIATGKAVDVRLEPGDIVFVPFTPFKKLAQLTEEVIDQFVRTVAVNEATYQVSGVSQPVQISAPYGSGIFTGSQPVAPAGNNNNAGQSP
jgi:protein involved in polysaccharide export with SLBB domain